MKITWNTFLMVAQFMIMTVVTLILLSIAAKSAELMAPYTVRAHSYSDHFYARRWAKLCKGGGRYVAMAEAHDLGKPNPCVKQ
jgi:hypothetical protein